MLVLFGLAFGALILLGVDAFLGISGVDLGPIPADPFAGFSETQPKFLRMTTRNGQTIFRSRDRGRHSWQRESTRQFPADKSSRTFRIFVVGGSSAAGVPYGVDYGFGAWLEKDLKAAAPDVDWQIVNAAFTGYATRRVLTIVNEIASYHPDLLIVYSGHNEFAEQRFYQHLLDRDPRVFRLMELIAATNLYRWWNSGDSATKTEPPTLDINDQFRAFEMFAVMAERAGGGIYPSERERAYGELMFRHNLRAIVRRMREQGTPTLLMTLSQNLADWQPGASSEPQDLSDERQKLWETQLAVAEEIGLDDCLETVQHYRAALEIFADHALTHYQLATCLRQIGDYRRAKRHYELANDLDRIPQGAPLSFNRVIRETAREESTLLVDAHALLEGASDQELVGSNFFVDFVHPNLDAHIRIAEAIAAEIRSSNLLPSIDWSETSQPRPSSRQLLTQRPQLRVDEHLALGLACILSLRRACVRDAANAALQINPGDEVAREYLAMLEGSTVWDFGTAESPLRSFRPR